MARIGHIITHRLFSAIAVLAVVIIFTFILLENAPGDAVDAYLLQIGGGDAALRATLREAYGLDQSWASRLWLYLSSLVTLDLGWSSAFERPVLSLIIERLPTTFLLMGSATLFAFVFGTSIGILAGSRPKGIIDQISSPVSLLLYATPGFWLGLVLILFLAVKWKLFPTSGIETVASSKTGLERALDIAWHLTLPVISLGLIYSALFLRVIKTAMHESWQSDYVAFAHSKGLSRSEIICRHILPNAALPLVTILGLQAATMLGGSVVIETLFAIPGFGRLAEDAVSKRDTPLLLGIILTSAIYVIIINLIIDLIYGLLDPRITNGQRR